MAINDSSKISGLESISIPVKSKKLQKPAKSSNLVEGGDEQLKTALDCLAAQNRIFKGENPNVDGEDTFDFRNSKIKDLGNLKPIGPDSIDEPNVDGEDTFDFRNSKIKDLGNLKPIGPDSIDE